VAHELSFGRKIILWSLAQVFPASARSLRLHTMLVVAMVAEDYHAQFSSSVAARCAQMLGRVTRSWGDSAMIPLPNLILDCMFWRFAYLARK